MFRASIIEKAGAKFDGIQKINGKDKFALATDPLTHSTFYLPIKGLTKKKVQRKLLKERKKIKSNLQGNIFIDSVLDRNTL